MAVSYYRMSSLLKAEAVLRRLESESGVFPSLPHGYALRKVIRVDHADGSPDAIVFEIDPLARLVTKPSDDVEISTR